MSLSIVTTMCGSAPYIKEFYEQICAPAQRTTRGYELMLVDGGSSDGSLQEALSHYRKDERIRVVALSRNLGYHNPIMTGADHALSDTHIITPKRMTNEP